ncbi:MAG: phosphate regulon transcriptional regulator PhoB [Alphaproteobacteria bacterium]|nr:phosphate regulon transcriptional regulator PhoB [Alphaproteobacteria bacterium]
MGGRILVVEDELAIREMIGLALSRAGFSYTYAVSTTAAQEELERDLPDLILLDWMLPGSSGIEFIRWLKRTEFTHEVPVVMLTARGEDEDKVQALNLGADDYVTKPFSPRELVARIEAVLRRTKPHATDSPVELCGLRIDPRSRRVHADGHAVDLGPIEFRMLHVLISQPDRVYSRAQLLDLVWGINIHVGERTVDMHISNLRKALAQHSSGHLIETVRGTGYRFAMQAQQ